MPHSWTFGVSVSSGQTQRASALALVHTIVPAIMPAIVPAFVLAIVYAFALAIVHALAFAIVLKSCLMGRRTQRGMLCNG